MELKFNIGLNQIIGLIRNLPYDEKLVIKGQLEKELKHTSIQNRQSITQLLICGPVMTVEGYNNYKVIRKQFQKWTKKLYV